MDISAAGGPSVESVLAVKREQAAVKVEMSLLRKGLDFDKEMMALLLRETGIGQNLDVKA